MQWAFLGCAHDMYSQEIGKFDANKKKFQSIVKNCLFLLLVLIYQDSRIQVKSVLFDFIM